MMMRRDNTRGRAWRWLAVVAAGTAMITTATCDPWSGTFDFYREVHHDAGIFDVYVDDPCFVYDCFLGEDLLFFD